jgi:hypothetical protein
VIYFHHLANDLSEVLLTELSKTVLSEVLLKDSSYLYLDRTKNMASVDYVGF